MRREISNAELHVVDLPPDDADWGVIETFALTFNGYDRWPGTPSCADVANEVAQTFSTTGQLPTDLDVLRSSLFFEQRRWRHFAVLRAAALAALRPIPGRARHAIHSGAAAGYPERGQAGCAELSGEV